LPRAFALGKDFFGKNPENFFAEGQGFLKKNKKNYLPRAGPRQKKFKKNHFFAEGRPSAKKPPTAPARDGFFSLPSAR